MKRIPSVLLPLLFILCLAVPAAWAQPATADAAFQAIHEKEWAWRQAEYGRGAGEDDDPNSSARSMPDVGPEAQQRRLAMWEDVLRQLDAIDPADLSEQNRVNLAVYRPQLEALAANVRLRAYEMPFNSDSSFWAGLGFMTRGDFSSADRYRGYAAVLRGVPRHFDQQIDNMRAGLARGFSVPRAVLEGRDVSIATVAELEMPPGAIDSPANGGTLGADGLPALPEGGMMLREIRMRR